MLTHTRTIQKPSKPQELSRRSKSQVVPKGRQERLWRSSRHYEERHIYSWVFNHSTSAHGHVVPDFMQNSAVNMTSPAYVVFRTVMNKASVSKYKWYRQRRAKEEKGYKNESKTRSVKRIKNHFSQRSSSCIVTSSNHTTCMQRTKTTHSLLRLRV